MLFGTKAQKHESGHGEFQAKEKFAKILVLRKQEPAVVPRPSQHLCVGCARCNLCHVQYVMPAAAKLAYQGCVYAFVGKPAHAARAQRYTSSSSAR